ncbi:MAG: phage tail protein [Xanthobacteraceae bacterium]|nr:phage tail protein [Xanthobacteraceae bacterium]
MLSQGTPYAATYYASNGGEWILHGFFEHPGSIPIGGGLDYWGTTAPSSNFVFAFGQALSRTAYPTLFARLGTTYGPGDGATTFNIPDKRGRVTAGKDDMGGTSANRLTGQPRRSTATSSAQRAARRCMRQWQAKCPRLMERRIRPAFNTRRERLRAARKVVAAPIRDLLRRVPPPAPTASIAIWSPSIVPVVGHTTTCNRP